MFIQNDVSQLKNDINRHIGSKVKLHTQKGRHKAVIASGTIENTYPRIFTVALDCMEATTRTVSYSYTDVLTKAIEITLCDA